ncbi:MAG: hypothetical protein V7L14_12470 [Nostoc sp.]|uniref:hypothetical protein n=1 Tax=Nostoc sp. TaxID=1180 RepID=UPI002FFAA3D6
MLKRSLSIIAASGILTTALISPALAVPADFIGTWVNKDANTPNITRLVITSGSGNKLNIQVFGKCHPSDCDWGTAPLLTYGINVQDTNHKYATANYNKGFANSFLTLGSARQEVLLQGYTQFLDNSGRQNYYSREHFQKQTRVR